MVIFNTELRKDVMPASPVDLEDLLLSTLDAVSRFRVGQREAVGAALDAGDLLTMAKARLPHGGWAEWLGRLGLKARTASTWMRLASMSLTAEEVIERGGINATLKGGKSATVADSLRPQSDLQRELEDAEQQIQDTKAAYYAALTARHRALRALAHQPQGFCGGRSPK